MRMLILLVLLTCSGCATRQFVPRPAALNPPPGQARITIVRQSHLFGGGRTMTVLDNDRPIGALGTGGRLIWDRESGPLVLAIKPAIGMLTSLPIVTQVGPNKTYDNHVNWMSVLTPVNYTPVVPDSMSEIDDEVDARQLQITTAPSPALQPLPVRSWDPAPVAVADLQSIGLSASESTTLSENVRYALVNTDYFKVVSRADMELLLHEASFQKSDVCSESQCLVEMGKLLSVSKIVGGTVGMAGGVYNFTLRFVDVETGRVEFSVYRDVEDAKQLLAAVRTLGEDLARKYAEKREME